MNDAQTTIRNSVARLSAATSVREIQAIEKSLVAAPSLRQFDDAKVFLAEFRRIATLQAERVLQRKLTYASSKGAKELRGLAVQISQDCVDFLKPIEQKWLVRVNAALSQDSQ